jgi:hypothetical protein
MLEPFVRFIHPSTAKCGQAEQVRDFDKSRILSHQLLELLWLNPVAGRPLVRKERGLPHDGRDRLEHRFDSTFA